MLLDLSEIFVCPRCRPTQGLIVLVEEIRDRRVLRGDLGCPACEARYPVQGGTLRFDASGEEADRDADPAARAGSTPEPGRSQLFRGASRREAGVRLAALLGLPEAEGPFLLSSALAGLAGPLAAAAEGEEVLALEGGGAEGGGPRESAATGRVTRIVGAAPADLPVFAGRLGGAAILEGSGETAREAVRTLREGGRLVVVEPVDRVRDAVGELPVEVAAEDPRALVAVRRF